MQRLLRKVVRKAFFEEVPEHLDSDEIKKTATQKSLGNSGAGRGSLKWKGIELFGEGRLNEWS